MLFNDTGRLVGGRECESRHCPADRVVIGADAYPPGLTTHTPRSTERAHTATGIVLVPRRSVRRRSQTGSLPTTDAAVASVRTPRTCLNLEYRITLRSQQCWLTTGASHSTSITDTEQRAHTRPTGNVTWK